MKRVIAAVVIIVFVSVSLTGCYYDKEDLVYPKITCDTTNLTYNASIEGIIKANCYACHSGTAAASFGVKLDSYTLFKSHTASGSVMQLITSKDPNVMMPKGGPALSDCEIQKINAWIKRGSPQ
ncbi:MAG TPA: hypothetical protein VF623_10910 [Segetibacter sp.]|jgi:cytochrome c553